MAIEDYLMQIAEQSPTLFVVIGMFWLFRKDCLSLLKNEQEENRRLQERLFDKLEDPDT